MRGIRVNATDDSSTWDRVFTLDVRKDHLPAWNCPVFRGFVVDEVHDHLHTYIDHVLFSCQLSKFPGRFSRQIDGVYIYSVSFDRANGYLAIGGHNQSGSPPLKFYDTNSGSFAWVTTNLSDDFVRRAQRVGDRLHDRYGPKIIDCPIRSVRQVDICSAKRLLALVGTLSRRDRSRSDESEGCIRVMTYEGETVAETSKWAASALAFHPKGTAVAVASGTDVLLLDAMDCSPKARRLIAEADLVSICFDATGDLVFTASEEGEIQALDADLHPMWSATIDAIPRCLKFDEALGVLWLGTNLGDLLAFDTHGAIQEQLRLSESVTDVQSIHGGKHLLVGCRNMDVHVFANMRIAAQTRHQGRWEKRLRAQKTSSYTTTASITNGRLFISYSSHNKEFASLLEKRLESEGFTCWRDEHSLVSGRITKQIRRAITRNDVVLVVLSSASLASDWVRWEIDSARDAEKATGQDIICPISIDTAWESWDDDPVLKREIMKYHILDFADWDVPGKFDQSHQRLLAGLRENYLAETS